MNRIESIKEKYKPGTRIRLINMMGEPQLKPGTVGTIDYVDDIGQIHMRWETGSSLALNIGVDQFEIV